MKKVAILQYRLLHYRTELFNNLRSACTKRGITLILVHGNATRRELPKRDEGSLSWAIKVENKVWEVGARDIIWQPLPAEAKDADLVITMQESRILSNYPLLMSRLWRNRKIAYWGHGKNLQSDAPTGLRERWKKLILKQVDWWFAYTSLTTDILRSAGFPDDQITQLNNAIDSGSFKSDLASCSIEEVLDVRQKLDIKQDATIGLFCGSLYPDKRLELLINASEIIRASLPNFELIVVGDGPSMQDTRTAARSRPWIHLTGMAKGREKAVYYKASDVILNPGAVGLNIVDAFCAGLPMITTTTARHGPEIAYLDHNRNGLIASEESYSYASEVVSLLQDQRRLSEMRAQSLADSERYTLDIMVDRFAAGIARALNR